MAQLTKLGEVLGLAMAAQVATSKVAKMLADNEHSLAAKLEHMREEAAETEERCMALAGEFDAKKTAILDQARETKGEAAEMMKTYLEGEDDALDGFESLTMAEAGEVGHWSIVRKINERAANDHLAKLVAWALPIQQRHHETVLNASLDLAGDEDPHESA